MRKDYTKNERKKKNKERSEKINDSSYYYAPEKLLLDINKKRKRNFKISLIVSVLGILLTALVIFLTVIYTTFFKLSRFEVSNDLGYTYEQVKSASGVKDGTLLYSINKDSVERNIMQSLPYITDVKVSRIWPDKLKVTLTAGKEKLYTQYGEYFYILTQDLFVLDKTTDIDKIENAKLIRFVTENAKECVIGRKLNIDDKDIPKIYSELYSALEKAQILTECTCIDISDKFDIKFEYKGRYSVVLGKMYDIEQKIAFMLNITEKLTDRDSGIIDVSDDNIQEGIFSPYS